MNSQQKEIIWIAGGTGLIGRHLSAAIDKDRYLIRILSRTPHNNSNHQAYIVWDPEHLTINKVNGRKKFFPQYHITNQ